MPSRTKWSGSIIVAVAVGFGFLMAQAQFPVNFILPFLALGVLVLMSMRSNW